MILFDDDPSAKSLEKELGITVQNCPSQTALTWEIYAAGIERWRERAKQPVDQPTTTTLNIAHFNDVYQVSDQKIHVDGKEETIDVTKFATLLTDITAKWEDKGNGRNGLIVFSGDMFSPSIESSVTRGKHMPAIANGLSIDISVAGNHEFDFGYPRLKELINNTNFPWLLSNIVDTNTGKVPEPMKEIHVLERAGLRIGLIGLVEKEWIATITGWPENFKYKDMAEVGRDLSVKLRDSAGQYKCDIIIALTHSRYLKDIKLARELFALSPAGQAAKNIASEHGVDLLLGGHDHVYWISKGVSGWDGFDLNTLQPDAADDQGDVLIVKSGTDYQDLSEVVLTLKETPAGSVRRQIIHEIKGRRHVTRGGTAVNEALKEVVDNELSTIKTAMKEPICFTEVQLDVRSSFIRLNESAIGNWIADCLRQAYDEALVKLGYSKTDAVMVCTGDFRGDRVYEPGPLTFGDLLTILPYLDPTVVVELDANTLWDALESGLSRWPAQEGRFPALSGLRVTFDSRKPAGQRVLGVWLLAENKVRADGTPELVDKEEVLRTSKRKYLIMCGEYMVQGGDGYDVLKGRPLPIPAENGQSKSALIRKFLLGAQFLNKKVSEGPNARFENLGSKTRDIIGGFETQLKVELPQLSLQLPDVPLKDYLGKLKMPSLPTSPVNIPSLPSSPAQISNVWGSVKGSVKSPSLSSISSFGSNRSRPSLPSLSPSRDLLSGAGDYVQSTTQAAKDAVQDAVVGIRWIASSLLFAAALAVADQEDMGLLDSYERNRARGLANLLRSSTVNINLRMNLRALSVSDDPAALAEKEDAQVNAAEADAKKTLPVIHPVVDGRLQDVAATK
ncbi:Metallo-dependent phosphatase [Punctularia strigosozonata HHB-11173 SS5]|uniref:Metallo-dependent phosphatase n=1 Tax=Punctularia strigosozonata (strain HHB-11173) TaxID=741275 RepID=UPI000441803A|nr:Metallo-dependent phosphatase [Punctularia strigosozonata HHB-11173 SS5]EIN11144.1 Metallo-dependent phosphatase [Punctularia strigosozonata HHB-11173 SS5]